MPWNMTFSPRSTVPVSYSLVGAPAGVRVDSALRRIITATPSNQPNRNCYFQVVATDAQGYADSFWVHLIDFAKPFPGATAVEQGELVSPGALRLALPNPYQPGASIRLQSPVDGQPLEITAYSITGRPVRKLICTSGLVSWDGRDSRGFPAPNGFYLLRLRQGKKAMDKIILLLK
jgi:hypothetical protein